MIAALRLAWSERSTREQRLLLVMIALAAIVVLWLGIIRPLGDALSAADARLAQAAIAQGDIAARVDELALARRTAPRRPDRPLDAAVNDAASAAGMTLSRVDLQGADRIAIGIGAVRGPALFDWLGGLARQGIVVERIALTANADATLSVDAMLSAAR